MEADEFDAFDLVASTLEGLSPCAAIIISAVKPSSAWQLISAPCCSIALTADGSAAELRTQPDNHRFRSSAQWLLVATITGGDDH